ncbi:MAG: low temperature requirement protein (LtrA) family protein, partial [Blastococcus sp.]|nr:low temperature requirement protein (LtrA) family protein [Blastococcus sp.]
ASGVEPTGTVVRPDLRRGNRRPQRTARPCRRRRARAAELAGIAVVQALWLLRLLFVEAGVLPRASLVPVFAVLVVLEVAVPPWAERTRPTSWHAHHIAERYGLFTIILLGESVFAASTGVTAAFEAGGLGISFVTIAVGGLVLLFALRWLYFLETSSSRAVAGWPTTGTGPISGGTATTASSRPWRRSAPGSRSPSSRPGTTSRCRRSRSPMPSPSPWGHAG